jgi:hypothetical protein
MTCLRRTGILWPLLWIVALSAVRVPEARAGSSPVDSPPTGRILRLLEVGSVLTDDGSIWVYRPDRGSWLKIDDAFREQQRQTHVLPLPVPVSSIRDMVTFGFILTNEGDCWLYLVEKDRWVKLPSPR